MSPTHGILAGAITTVVVASGIYALAYFTTATAQEELVSKNVELARAEAEQVNASKIEAIVKQTKPVREELQSYFLSSEDPIQFLDLLEQSAQDADVLMEVESLSKSDESSKNTKQETIQTQPSVKVAIRVSGSWNNIYHLLSLLETMPYSISVNKVNVEKKILEDEVTWIGQIHIIVDSLR